MTGATNSSCRASHRDVPRVVLDQHQRAGGWCELCGQPTVFRNATWHHACWQDYRLLSEPAALLAVVVERDGLACAWCAKPGWVAPRPAGAHSSRQLHLDHIVPLWAVVDVAPAMRRAFHAPANLQLLCVAHHTAKTSAEARARAEMKRRAPPAAALAMAMDERR